MKADPAKIFAAALRDCQLGIKAFQNVASSLEVFQRLLDVRSCPEPDRVLMTALFHMAVVRYAKPFTATKTPEGKKTYPTARVSGAEGFTARIHEHLLKVRHTLIAHDDFSEIVPRLLGLDLTPSEGSASIPVAVAVANCCLEYPTLGIEAMTRHVAALRHALLQNLAGDLARYMQVTRDHPAAATAANKQPPRRGTLMVPPMGTASLVFDPASDPFMDVPRPTFEDLGIVYEYANCIATKGHEAPMEISRGLFVRTTVGTTGSSAPQPGGGRVTATQERSEEPEMAEHQDWRRVLQSVTTLLEFVNEFEPTQPRSAFGATRARFQEAAAEFMAKPSLDAAIRLDELGQWLVQGARELPAAERVASRSMVMAALEQVRTEAEKHK